MFNTVDINLHTGEPVTIFLAEDDYDDCYLFQYTLKEMNRPFLLTTVKNGEDLMNLLSGENTTLPDFIFLDINMPRKNGFECLKEIKESARLQHLIVIILSTSFTPMIGEQLFKGGAQYYIRKPNDVIQFQKVIEHVLTMLAKQDGQRPVIEDFLVKI